MNDFFEPPPPPPAEPEIYREPPWAGPPQGTLPGVVALELVLAQTDKVAVCVTRVAAYPTGFAFDVVTMSAPGQSEGGFLDPMAIGSFGPLRHRGPGADGELPATLIRIGVQFADGSKATNTSSGFDDGTDVPAGPMMRFQGGGGSGANWRQGLWVWPLPPPGSLEFVCEWPAAGIPLTRHEIDAQTILDAVARAQIIFSDEHLPDRPRGVGP